MIFDIINNFKIQNIKSNKEYCKFALEIKLEDQKI